MRTIALALPACMWLAAGAFAQNHFQPVESTGEAYIIVAQSATWDGAGLQAGDEIGVFDGPLCVGAAVVDTFPVAASAWRGFPQFGLDGYTPGNPIKFKLWRADLDEELRALADYAEGDGTFGGGFAAEVEIIGATGPAQFNIWSQTGAIGPAGGDVEYVVQLLSMLPNSVPGVNYWTTVTAPNGQEVGPTFQIAFTLLPFMDVPGYVLNQSVPGNAPGGTYTLTGHVGFYPNALRADSVEFTKLGGLVGPFSGGDREVRAAPGPFAGVDVAAPEPSRAELAIEARPNPFNAATELTITLSNPARVTITVHDVLGREVATIADNAPVTGARTIAFDASALPSGIYFARAVAAGRTAVSKLILMK
ncbi:MAG: hypothetical protein MAG453_00307 [Calditrichaeota bacterium]|nr:hypothetical protein [Calditrichota bacterium]